jgi:uncharacterized protein
VPLAPTAPGERLVQLDVLRGLALFGVLLENLQHFVVPSYAAFAAGPDATWLDQTALGAVRLLCDNKVYAIFAFLFGYGIALQMRRTESGFVGIHLWRMAILFLIGVAHSMLWDGDILATYALLGILLLPLRNRRDSVLRSVTVGGLVAPSLVFLSLVAWAGTLDLTARDALAESVAAHTYPLRQSSFAFAAFTLGLASGRRGALADAARFVARTRSALVPALVVGGLCNIAALPLLDSPGQGSLSKSGIAIEVLLAIATPTLAFVYVHLALHLFTRPDWSARLRPIADVGRTTLTNYLLQSAVGVAVLARTGLGPLGPITPPVGIVLAVALFAAQVAASRWWLARFRFGPVEWLWRAATYGTLPPLRVPGQGR